MAGVLIAGGGFCLQKSLQGDHKYLAMAAMPVVVGLQQLAEGMAWIGAENADAAIMHNAAFCYMFFVWVFWPSWVPFMASVMEPDPNRKKLMKGLAALGLALGALLYVPYLYHSDWLNLEIIRHSLSYDTILLTDAILPRNFTYLIYLSFIGGTPLLSSHHQLRYFGCLLVALVPLTYFFFIYAYISVLCFFAAVATAHLIYIIAGDKCRDRPVPLEIPHFLLFNR